MADKYITKIKIPGQSAARIIKDTTAVHTQYTHPTYTSKTSGLYKITVDGTGHVSAATAVAKADITGLGIPAQDTVYTHPTYTSKTSGLYKITVDGTGHVSAATAIAKADITGLGIPAQDTVYTHPSATATTAAAVKVGCDDKGHVVLGAALTAADVGAATSGHNHDSAYLKLSGGTLTDGSITKVGAKNAGSWRDSRDKAIIQVVPTNTNSFYPGIGFKTTSGHIQIGVYPGNADHTEKLWINYGKDTDYNNNSNTVTHIIIPNPADGHDYKLPYVSSWNASTGVLDLKT